MSLEGEQRFFSYARERYRILLRQRGKRAAVWTEGLPKSGKWTNDPILQQYRFCNVFREDDKVTKWIRQRLTHESYGDQLGRAMVIARWFNRIETLERLLPPPDCDTPYFTKNMLYAWDSDEVRRRLEGVNPIVTGAYMIKTPGGMSKLDGLIWCIEHLEDSLMRDWTKHLRMCNGLATSTLERATDWLQRFPYLGAFMAYEVVTDLRHTPLLDKAPDIMTWANPGPGAMRGYGRVASGDPDHYSRGNRVDVDMVIQGMRDLLRHSRNEHNWPVDWPSWEMRDVEHTLCEFDKYERARLGEGTPKQRYDGGLKQ